MWVSENTLMEQLVARLGLQKERKAQRAASRSPPGQHTGGALGLWNGREFVFEPRNGLLGSLSALWRYGLAPLDIASLSSDLVRRFLHVYDAPPTGSLADLFRDIDVLNETQVPLAKHLRAHGIAQRFIDELASAGFCCVFVACDGFASLIFLL